MEEVEKKDEVVEQAPQEQEQEQEQAPTSLTEEGVRKICEEIIGAFLDKFTPPEVEQEKEENEEQKSDDFDY